MIARIGLTHPGSLFDDNVVRLGSSYRSVCTQISVNALLKFSCIDSDDNLLLASFGLRMCGCILVFFVSDVVQGEMYSR